MTTIVPRHIIGSLDLTEYPFAIIQRASDYGAPQNVAEVIDSMLQDGEIVSSTRTSNRTMSHSVFIEESDMQALAQAESQLILECDKQRNTWSIDPGDGYGAVTVFDIFRAQATFVHDDDWEWHGYRRYDLTFPALPFGRSETEVVTDALASGAVPSSTVISDGSSATNWTGTSTITPSGGWLQQTVSSTLVGWGMGVWLYDSVAEWTYTPGAPLDFSDEVYLAFDFDPPGSAASGYMDYAKTKLYADGVEQRRVAIDQPSASVYRLTFLVTDTSVASLKLVTAAQTESISYPAPSMTHKIDNVTMSNQAPNASTTGRQSMRTVAVEGSARTQATLSVQHETVALGTTLIYTAPALDDSTLGYQPPLRRWRTAGSADASDAASISGTRSRLTGTSGATFNIPSSVLPRGTGVLVGRLRMNNATARTGKVTWTASTNVGGTLHGSKDYTSPVLSLNGSGGTQQFVVLGSMTLPPTDLPAGSAGTIQLDTFEWSDSDEVNFDELWWFWLGEEAALTWVEPGTSKRLWLDPASLLSPVPTIWAGSASDRSDAVHAGGMARAWSQHSFRPTTMNVFVATETAQNPAVALRHPPRWHTHAEQLEE